MARRELRSAARSARLTLTLTLTLALTLALTLTPALTLTLTKVEQAAARMNECPLGSGALAGNPFGIDREALSDSLGFARPVQNSIDAVSDRDFVAELSFWAAMLQVHQF